MESFGNFLKLSRPNSEVGSFRSLGKRRFRYYLLGWSSGKFDEYYYYYLYTVPGTRYSTDGI